MFQNHGVSHRLVRRIAERMTDADVVIEAITGSEPMADTGNVQH